MSHSQVSCVARAWKDALFLGGAAFKQGQPLSLSHCEVPQHPDPAPRSQLQSPTEGSDGGEEKVVVFKKC